MMTKIVKRNRSGETGLCIETRWMPTVDANGEEARVEQSLVWWPTQGYMRWIKNSAITTLSGKDAKEQ